MKAALNLGGADAEKDVMAQLSRTYQVVLILVAVLALAWFTVLRDQVSKSSSGSSSSSSSQSARSSSQGSSSSAQAATHVYKGPLPGLKGLSKDINRAHEAVSTANAQSRRLESATGSAQAPSAKGTNSPSAAGPSVAASTATKTQSPSSHSSAATHGANSLAGSGGGSPASSTDASNGDQRAVTVEKQLKQGKIVLLLFWNFKSFDDQAVHSQVLAASHALSHSVATDFAKPSEVGDFGTVTRDISVLQTPTLLVINQKGLATTITGLTDAFSIEQAVREAR